MKYFVYKDKKFIGMFTNKCDIARKIGIAYDTVTKIVNSQPTCYDDQYVILAYKL